MISALPASDETGNNVLKSLGLDSASANKIDAQNAKITLNGTEYEATPMYSPSTVDHYSHERPLRTSW